MTNVVPRLIAVLILVAGTACQAPQQEAAPSATIELHVVTSGGFTAAYNILAQKFEAETGIKLVTEFGASSGGAPTSIPMRLARGEQFDVVILADYSMDNLINEGYIDSDTRRDLALSRIGMSVRAGAEKPDISTPEAFVQTLRDAESIGYSASASGTYLSRDLLPRLGLWEELGPKGRRIVTERVGAVVARGDVEIGFQQVSELLPIEGADFVAPIPDEYQKVTVYSAGVTINSGQHKAAVALLDYVSSTDVAATIAATGLVPLATR